MDDLGVADRCFISDVEHHNTGRLQKSGQFAFILGAPAAEAKARMQLAEHDGAE